MNDGRGGNILFFLCLLSGVCLFFAASLSNSFAQEAEMSGYDFSFPEIPIPPIAVGGNVNYRFITQRNGKEDRGFGHFVNATAIGQTYIWQPWFSTANGYITLSESYNSVADEKSSAGNVTGELNLKLLPLSNFPTTLTYTRTDSSTESGSASQKTASDSVSMGSSVRWDQTLNMSTNMAYSVATQSSGSEVAAASVELGGNKIFEASELSARIRYAVLDQSTGPAVVSDTTASTSSGSQNQETSTLSVRHQYTPWENVSYDSTSSILLDTSSATTETREATTMQATSSLRWSPEESPMSVSAVWSALTDATDTTYTNPATVSGDTSAENARYAGRIGMIYNFSDQMTGDVSANGQLQSTSTSSTAGTASAATNEGGDGNGMLFGGAANLNYTSLTTPLFGFDWSWNSGASVDGQGGSLSPLAYAEQVSGGQSISSGVVVPYLGLVDWNVSQNANVKNSTTSGVEPSIAHSTLGSYQEMEGERWTVISLGATDTRSFTDTGAVNQLVNMQISKGLTPDVSSTWNANVTLQLSRQAQGDDEGVWNSSSQGTIGYQRRNLFNTRALDLAVNLSLSSNTYQPLSFQSASDANEANTVSWSRELSTTLNYTIGQVALQGNLQLTQNQDNEISDMFTFNILRGF